ncbi:MAG: hypothetical protein FWH14_03965 [Oscillospiraceae bacterium]|nr:hypothetical protein [Oscillospiraceae bacterium]
MRHLFVINPAAYKIKGRLESVYSSIDSFLHFTEMPELKYEIHVSRFPRDIFGYVRKCVMSSGKEPLRIHVFGGTGSVFEALCGIDNFSHAEIAAYPMGRFNDLVSRYGKKNFPLFSSIKNQLYGGVMDLDVIRCGSDRNSFYAANFICVGLGAEIAAGGSVPRYFTSAYRSISGGEYSSNYRLIIDGERVKKELSSIYITSHPSVFNGLYSSASAVPDSGKLDIYTVDNISKYKAFSLFYPTNSDKRKKHSYFVNHNVCRRVTIESDKTFCLSIDGEIFYEKSIDVKILPGALKFICPEGIKTYNPVCKGRR